MKKTLCICLTLFLLLCMLSSSSAETATPVDVVAVEGGLVQGIKTEIDGVQLFKGIPYAATTEGKNRWKAPQPVEPWEGIRICDAWGDQAMQIADLNPPGTFWGDEFSYDPEFIPPISESGLNLNVYTPAKTTEDKLPVLMFIHGGANDHGCASEPEFYATELASRGIIVITVQYRVSTFGFAANSMLAEENNGACGNYAALDLIQALKWIHNYIAGFGGNPNEVTIAGQSAGAMNVIALLRSPLAKGLFNKAIIESGFVGLLTSDSVPKYTDLETAKAAGDQAILDAFGEAKTLEELRALDASYFMNTPAANGNGTIYSVLTGQPTFVIDNYVFTDESYDLNREGALDGIDIIIGGTSDEMTSLFGNPEGIIPMDNFAGMMAHYGEDYLDAYNPKDEHEAYTLYLRSMSDASFASYIVSAAYVNQNNDSDAYVYYFSQKLPGRNDAYYGAFHSAELWYLFDSMRDIEGQRPWTEGDHQLADQISTYISNFVKTGNPNGEGLPEWKVCSGENNGAFMEWGNSASECKTELDPAIRFKKNFDNALLQFGQNAKDLGF